MAKVSRRRRKVGVDGQGRPVYRDEGWKVRYVDPDGRERYEVFKRKADADSRALEVEHGKRTGAYVDPRDGRQTFREYAERWRAAQLHRPATVDQLESHLRLHIYPRLGSRPIAAVRRTEIQALVKDRAEVLAPATLEVVVGWLRTIFKAAVEDRIITTSPASKVSLPDAIDRDPVIPFPVAKVRALHDALPERWQLAVTLGAGCGLRHGEAMGLTVDQVDFLRRELHVRRQLITPARGPLELGPPKTKASWRTIPLPALVVDELASHVARFPPGEVAIFDRVTGEMAGARLLFTTSTGRAVRRSTWSEKWTVAVAAAGEAKGTRFHRLRHTYASVLIAAGCSVKVVQERLGHATAQETLDTYAHLWPEDDDRTRAAVEAALGEAFHPVTVTPRRDAQLDV